MGQLNVEKPGGSSTLLMATYTIVALRTWRGNPDRCAAHVSWTDTICCAISLIQFPNALGVITFSFTTRLVPNSGEVWGPD